MLILLGIFILIISFVIALISLVREEKRNQQMLLEDAEEAVAAEQAKAAVVDAAEEHKPTVKPLEELKAKIDAEEKRQSQEAGLEDEELTIVDKGAVSLPDLPAEREAFPWEEPADEKSALVPGDNVLESVVEETVDESADEDQTLEQSRLPNLGTGQKPLSGSFKLKKD